MKILGRWFGRPAAQQAVAGSNPVVIDLGVTPRATVALSEVPLDAALQDLLAEGNSIEAASGRGRTLVPCHFHPVAAAIHKAFADHRPLVLSPDIMWLVIAQGFANHVNANAENLRSQFVAHAGKLVLNLRRDDFVKGSAGNAWPDVFGEFTGQIREHIGAAAHDSLLPTFSTTGATETAAAQVVLLDAMQSYFEYRFHTLCGVPEIVLEGTADDWDQLAKRTHGLGRFGLRWWTRVLEPLLKEFVAAARGRADPKFWKSIYKINADSGGPFINGWIIAFFPYLKDPRTRHATVKNDLLTNDRVRAMLDPSSDKRVRGITTERLPGGLACAPFKWRCLEEIYAMEFLGGFVGIRQDRETLGLRPEIGWAVREQKARAYNARLFSD